MSLDPPEHGFGDLTHGYSLHDSFLGVNLLSREGYSQTGHRMPNSFLSTGWASISPVSFSSSDPTSRRRLIRKKRGSDRQAWLFLLLFEGKARLSRSLPSYGSSGTQEQGKGCQIRPVT